MAFSNSRVFQQLNPSRKHLIKLGTELSVKMERLNNKSKQVTPILHTNTHKPHVLMNWKGEKLQRGGRQRKYKRTGLSFYGMGYRKHITPFGKPQYSDLLLQTKQSQSREFQLIYCQVT